jgi:hypothetical protein
MKPIELNMHGPYHAPLLPYIMQELKRLSDPFGGVLVITHNLYLFDDILVALEFGITGLPRRDRLWETSKGFHKVDIPCLLKNFKVPK